MDKRQQTIVSWAALFKRLCIYYWLNDLYDLWGFPDHRRTRKTGPQARSRVTVWKNSRQLELRYLSVHADVQGGTGSRLTPLRSWSGQKIFSFLLCVNQSTDDSVQHFGKWYENIKKQKSLRCEKLSFPSVIGKELRSLGASLSKLVLSRRLITPETRRNLAPVKKVQTI